MGSESMNVTQSSPFKAMVEVYLDYRTVCGRKPLAKSHPLLALRSRCGDGPLTQEIIDEWWAVRPNESATTHAQRVRSLFPGLDFIGLHGWLCHLHIPDYPDKEHARRHPLSNVRYVSLEEARNLFQDAGHIDFGRGAALLLNRLEVPVMLILMYCCGLRPMEARLLRREDLDLEEGTLHIVDTKGYVQHLVMPHRSVLQRLGGYLTELDAVMPVKSHMMFPDINGNPHSATWLLKAFKLAWNKGNADRCTPYALRHAYVINNIYSWVADGDVGGDKFLALSKSLGHTSIKMTAYYFSLVPGLGNESLPEEAYKNIIPEVSACQGKLYQRKPRRS